MEADWEIEIGAGAPVIDAWWPGRIDLRQQPWRIAEIVETAAFPALAECLLNLNADGSRVRTSKCDVWQLGAGEMPDAGELDARPDEAVAGVACYIDLVPESMPGDETMAAARFGTDSFPAQLNQTCGLATRLVERLRRTELGGARVDLVLRSCATGGGLSALDEEQAVAISVYVSACGSDLQRAKARLGLALALFTQATLETRTGVAMDTDTDAARIAEKIQWRATGE